jgi:hypothetical protein
MARYFFRTQRALNASHNTTKQVGMKISPLNSKVMAFEGRVPVRSKIVTDDTVLVQVNTFTYSGYKTSYNEERDIT